MRSLIVAAALVLAAGQASAAAVFTASGANPGDIQGTVDAFRTALGINNGNAVGAQGGGRREINWDGGGGGAPATTFANPMETFAFRGNVFTTPGAGFEISGQPTPEFGDLNPTYPDIFQPFSAPRIFAPLGGNITDVRINVPGNADGEAVTNAFGVVFLDVDFADTTSIEFFDRSGATLGLFNAQVADNGLSFLGVVFDDAVVAAARIVTGNAALGPNDGAGVDVVAMDDFIFGEPVAVPEPTAWVLMILGFGGVGAALRSRRRAAFA